MGVLKYVMLVGHKDDFAYNAKGVFIFSSKILSIVSFDNLIKNQLIRIF